MDRFDDGSAGDADYGRIGEGYAAVRQPDPGSKPCSGRRSATHRRCSTSAPDAGSYEPYDRQVTAVEPSASMRAERPAFRSPAIDATSDALPFADKAFDASMASITIHQWPHLEAGLREMRRVTRGPVVILTFSPEVPEPWWQPEYVPELFEVEARRMPALDRVAGALGGEVDIRIVPVPADCIDGFGQAFFARPNGPSNRACVARCPRGAFSPTTSSSAMSGNSSTDLDSGAWDARWGRFRTLPEFDVGLRLVVALAVSRP